jgi:hypothetical protein
VIADLDGDDRDEIAVRMRDPDDRSRATLLVRQTDDGGLEPLVLGHCEPLAAVRRPATSADAARDRRDAGPVGARRGRRAVPAGGDPGVRVGAAPATLTDEPLRQRWTRADDLAVAGMPASAAEVLRDGASMVGDEAVRRRFRDRAAALFAVAGQPEAALALDAGNLEDPELAPGALLRRATLLTDLGAYQEAATPPGRCSGHPGRDARRPTRPRRSWGG